jgi:hypothetical protein
MRVAFETDAEDTYFVRDSDAGAWRIRRRIGDHLVDGTEWITTGPKAGAAQLWFDELPEDADPGSRLEYIIEVSDPSRIDPFHLELMLEVTDPRSRDTTPSKRRSSNANVGKGKRGGDNSALSLPEIHSVHRDQWGTHDFHETSALRVVHVGTDEDPEASVYDFYVNVDNKYLLHSYKQRGADSALLEKQFLYGMVLVGLALIQDHKGRSGAQRDREGIEAVVLRTTAALGPILVPMLQTIGSLDADYAL